MTKPAVQPQDVGHNGVTLLDMFMGISAAWALPAAVQDVMGRRPLWLVAAFLIWGAQSLWWLWQFRKVQHGIAKRLFPNHFAAGRLPASSALLGIYLTCLAASFGLQYGLYRGLRLALLRAAA